VPVVEQTILLLRPRALKWWAVLVLGLVFSIGGYLMLLHGKGHFYLGKGWFCLIFFGFVALVAMLQLLPGASQIVVTSTGLYTTVLFRKYFIAFAEIEHFGVAEWTQWHGPFRVRHRLVAFNVRAGTEALRSIRRGAAFVSALSGYHGALPDNYGYKHQELAELLNRFLKASRNRIT